MQKFEIKMKTAIATLLMICSIIVNAQDGGKMPAEPPEMLVRNQMESLSTGNLDMIKDQYHEELEVFNNENISLASGKSAVVKYWEEKFKDTEPMPMEAMEVLEFGNKAFVRYRKVDPEKGNPELSGAIFEFKDSKIYRIYFL